MSCWTVIAGASLPVTPWRNGLGVSRDIVTRLGPDGRMVWQVGIADLERDGPFSYFEHGDRIFTPIAGDPAPQLAFHGGAFKACPLLIPKHFSGEWPTLSRIPAPGRAFNAIVDRRFHTVDVQVLRLEAGDAVAAPDAPHVVIHCLTGRIAAAGDLLSPGDSLLGAGPANPGAMAEDGVVIVVAIGDVRA